ncbi:flagellin [Lysinibacillus sp. BW-2-10]|uniref:flagellin N-terminal helical domain-containing protein n=1 Tax=Lysinibacillus sp. BW-2-10 TaxID=2590030 RepID=UPI00117E4AAA|nr:flagellin [Lysinibacillus sp. BW-2-10]TSI07325.1 flagellin [Lysinibacillus sp. BW-2-10]
MRINHNIAALNTSRQLGAANNNQAKSMEKLSSGLRINRAGDDAAGLAISEKMRAQVRGLDQASSNAQDGISLIQTAEGALNETHSILQRMRELAVQSSNDTNTDTDREELQKEVDQLISEIDRIGNTTEFNTKKLLNGELKGVVNEAAKVTINEASDAALFTGASAVSAANLKNNTINLVIDKASTAGATATYTIRWTDAAGNSGTVTQTGNTAGTVRVGGTGNDAVVVSVGALSTDDLGKEVTVTARKAEVNLDDESLTYQIGANSSQTMRVSIEDMRSSALNVDQIDVSSSGAAEASISAINKAIEDVSAQRSKLGAFQNRLEHTINNLGTSSENLTAAESRIRDVDMAKEMMNQTKESILAQASQAMLAQANQKPQAVLQLLQ